MVLGAVMVFSMAVLESDIVVWILFLVILIVVVLQLVAAIKLLNATQIVSLHIYQPFT